RHGEHVVGVQRAQRLVGGATAVLDDDAVLGTDQLVVVEHAAVGVELPAGLQRDRVEAVLRIGELDLVAQSEGSGAVQSTARGARSRAGGPVMGGGVRLLSHAPTLGRARWPAE